MIKHSCIFLIFAFLFCTKPQHKVTVINSTESKVVNDEAGLSMLNADETSDERIDTTIIAPMNKIAEWPGKSFCILPKQQMFASFGYEIYLSGELEKSSAALDTSLELRNHRIRTDKISGHTIICKSADSLDGEWLICMMDSVLGRELYMRTHKSAVKEIVLQSDLDAAQKRWNGKKVYSARGIISTIDKNGGYGSLRVSARDSLMVDSVVYGVTPLPVNPIWIIVHTKDGKNGFIPVRISFSNMMNDLPVDGKPWDEDIIERNPAKEYNWDESVWNVVDNHNVVSGMSFMQVFLSWGKPLRKFTKTENGSILECWKYQSQTLCFLNEKVHSIVNDH